MLPLFNKGSFLFAFELFQKYSASKDFLAPEDGCCFLLLLLQAIVIVMSPALINAKAKSVIVFAIILFSWGIERETVDWWLDLFCLVTPKAMMIYDQLCLRHHEAGHLSLLKLEGLQSKEWSVNQDYRRSPHTVKLTKLANMITLERSLITQSQKLVNSIHKTTGENH